MNTLQAVARILKTEGVEWVACFPSNNLIEAVAKEGIRPIMFRQERGALMAADGFSRMNNRQKFGVVITQGGPGSENSMGGLAQAFGDNIPILYLPGGPALAQHSVQPNFSPVRTYQTVSTYGEVIWKPDMAASVMRRAFHHLRNGRPGPVIVEIPADVGTQEVPEAALHYQPPKRSAASASAGDVKDAVRLLLGAKKPLIWSGMGTLMAEATPSCRTRRAAGDSRCTAPCPASPVSMSAIPWRWAPAVAPRACRRAAGFKSRDVLLALGSSLTRTSYGQPIPDGKTIIHNTESIEDINKDYNVAVGLPGDAKLTIQMLIDEVKGQLGENGRKGQNNVAAEIAEIKQQWLSEWTDLLNSNEVPINTYRVIGELERTLDKENSIVTHDAGAPRDTIMPFYTATVPHSYVGWGKTTHLGYGIPLMIGTKLAKPDKFCLNFMGDGAFGMSGLDIETSVRAGAPITTIVLNNGDMATYPGGYPVARARVQRDRHDRRLRQDRRGSGRRWHHRDATRKKSPPALKRAQQLNAEGKTVLLDIHSNMEARRSRFDQGGGG